MSLRPRSLPSLTRLSPAPVRRSRLAGPVGAYSPVTNSAPVEALEGRVLLATHLTPVADSFVRNNAFRDVNYGASPFLWVKTQSPSGGDSRIGYLRFNVNSLNADEIGSATLYLAGALQSPTSPPITAGIFPVSDNSWQEGNGNVSVRRRGAAGGGGSQLTGSTLGDGYDTAGGIDWDNQPGTGASPLATARVERDTFNTYAFDLTQYVKSQVAGGGNSLSLAIKGNEETTAFMRFISSDFAGPGKPQLVVTRAGQANGSFVRTNVSAPDLGAAGGASHAVSVFYNADAPIDLSSFGPDDLTVRRADGAALQVLNYSPDTPFNSSAVNVTYFVGAPGGTWDRGDNGVYTVELARGSVRDVSGNDNSAGLGSFRVAVDDAQGPTASIAADPVTAPGGNTYRFSITYGDDVAIDAESININNVAVTGLNGTVTLPVTQVDVTPDADAAQVTATYTVLAPGGSWDATDNGIYSIVPRNTQVRDTAGHDLSESLGNFQVSIGPPDNQAPVVTSATAPNVTSAGGTGHDVTVIYSDDVAIDSATLGTDDITVTGPRGALTVRAAAASQPGDGPSRTVTYTLTPPDGSWDAADNGAYAITVNAGAVRDTSGNATAAATGSFDVNASSADTAPPAASLSSAPGVSAGGGTYSFVVTYSDNVAVRASTIDGADVLVTGPGGASLPVVGVALDPNADASQIAVTYTVAARGGSWDPSDNGQYTITINGNQVADTAGNVLAGPVQAGTFDVAVPQTDTNGPSADIDALNVTAESGSYSFAVTYRDNVGINPATVGVDDVTVTGPGGPLTVTSTQSLAAGTDLTVTYFATPPGNSWDEADNGQYTITVNANAVADTSGNGVAAKSQSFNVNLNRPDTFGPQATISVPDVLATGTSYTVSIKWQDDTSVKGGSIDVNDVVVTRGGVPLTVLAADVTPKSGPSVTAQYTIQPPGGTWDPSDNGTYTVTVVPGEVRDTADHEAQPGATTFTVNVADSATPTAAFSVANIDASSAVGERQRVFVTYQDDVAIDVATLDSGDITITGPGGIVLVPVQVSQSEKSNAPSVVVTYEIDPPGGTWDVSDNGLYTITINPGAVKDAAGNDAVGSATFTVSVPGEQPIDGAPVNTGFTIEALATQDDGKVVLVGRQASPNIAGGFQSVVQRRNPDGTLDASFGNAGQVLGDPATSSIYYAVVLTANGIVTAGSQDGHWILARYDALGRPDAAFGDGGRTVTTFNANNEAAYALAVDPRDGKLVAAGGTPAGPEDGQPDQNFGFARYTPNGVLDVTFAQGGLQVFDINGEDIVGAVTVLPDGRIVAAGSSGKEISLFRLLTSGEADPAFSGDGFFKFDATGLQARQDVGFFLDHSQALAVQDDKILVGNHTPDGNFGVARIDANGNLDSSFGSNGIASIDLGGPNDDVDALVLQPTGEILAVGTSDSGTGGSPVTAVAALDRNGGLITGWNAGGKLTFAPDITPGAGRELHIGQLVLRAFGTRQSDGRLVVGSSDRSPTPTSSAFRKINVPGVTAAPEGELQGVFGVGSTNRGKRYAFTDADGTVVTFSLKGNATGRVYLSGDKLNVRIEDQSGGTVPCVVSMKAKGGDKRFKLGDLVCTGGLKSLSAKTGDLSGTMYVRGMAGKLSLGNVSGTVAASGAITSLVVNSLTNAKVLSGANLGANADLGGTGADADTFDRGFIGALKVATTIKGSIVAAGLKPMDETIGDANDVVVGGVGADGGPFSIIRTISARGGADETSQFIAGGFGAVKLPRKIDPATDPQSRFTVK